MAQDDYIKNLMSNLRPNDRTQPVKGNPVNGTGRTTALSSDIILILEQVKDLKIDGEKKRLIKIDDKNEEILKVLYPVFAVDVTRFINFLLSRFFKENPELIAEIKKSFKHL